MLQRFKGARLSNELAEEKQAQHPSLQLPLAATGSNYVSSPLHLVFQIHYFTAVSYFLFY